MNINQNTLKNACTFEGKGLHSGKPVKMTVKPAPANHGVVFHRVDLGEDALIKAVATNVTSTARSTTLTENNASISTLEHLMSALYGMGIDNVLVEIDNVEVPILDGSASQYIKAFTNNIQDLGVERKYINLSKEIELKDEKTGSWIKLSPCDQPSYDITVDFNSKVLGVQKAHWDMSIDYAKEIGVCRTFVFFHELEFLFANNLIKGGDVDNAIVIVEHPVTEEKLDEMAKLLNKSKIKITDSGYLNNLSLHFVNECGRHKMLDLIGDLALVGGYLNARVTAFKPGHTINTRAAQEVLALLNK